MRRGKYAFVGLLVAGAVDLIINLLAASIQDQAFSNQFTQQSICLLAGLAIVGILLGYWLGAEVSLPKVSSDENPPSTISNEPETVTVSRFHAFLSYIKLRGKGIHLKDIVVVGSRIDIDTKN